MRGDEKQKEKKRKKALYNQWQRGNSMARHSGKQYGSSVVPGLVHVWTTSVERTAYRMITRHYLGYWHALGRRIEARRYTAEVYNDIDGRHAVCIVASTAAEMQARVHAHIERVIVAAQYDGYAREYVADQYSS